MQITLNNPIITRSPSLCFPTQRKIMEYQEHCETRAAGAMGGVLLPICDLRKRLRGDSWSSAMGTGWRDEVGSVEDSHSGRDVSQRFVNASSLHRFSIPSRSTRSTLALALVRMQGGSPRDHDQAEMTMLPGSRDDPS
jgi:hypothetical protein